VPSPCQLPALSLSRAEGAWLDRLSSRAGELPENEGRFVDDQVRSIDRRKVGLDQCSLGPPADDGGWVSGGLAAGTRPQLRP
jgi:hypothetical protein